jgi:hypothetical protein
MKAGYNLATNILSSLSYSLNSRRSEPHSCSRTNSSSTPNAPSHAETTGPVATSKDDNNGDVDSTGTHASGGDANKPE